MAISVLQTNTSVQTTYTTTTLTTTLTGVTSGSLLLLGISTSSGSGSRTFSGVSDTVNGSWTKVIGVKTATNRQTEIWKFVSSGSGNLTITTTCTNTQIWMQAALEVAGADSTPEATDTVDQASTTPMYAMQATGFNVTAGALVLGCIAPEATVSAATLDSDYTGLVDRPVSSPQGVVAYRIIGGSDITNERMNWTNTTPRAGPGCAASFPVAAAGPSGPPSGSLALLGVGT